MRTSLALGVVAIGLAGSSACTGQLTGPDGKSPDRPLGPGIGGASSGAGGGTMATPATDPGRVTLHRLNRTEYNNTMRDLLGTTSDAGKLLPNDDSGAGLGAFDNMADTLTLSDLHLSVYLDAAKSVVSEALSNAAERASLVSCDVAAQGETCVRQVVRAFAYRAWRRPVTDAEVDRLVAVAGVALANGESYEQGLGLALRAVLLSPHFVFRVELDPDPTSLTAHPLNPYELASRLSYFLWSSTPDTTLLETAASGSLSQPAVLEQQVGRLFDDPRSARAMTGNFAGQWLVLRNIDNPEETKPDPTLFQSVDTSLLSAMRAEAEHLFQDVAFQGAPLTQLFTANYTYVNDRLAAHYGLPPVGSSDLKRVDLTSSAERGGFLSEAGFLTLTSHPNMTSPVRRGKWVTEVLFCYSVPAAPKGVNLKGIEMGVQSGLTQREASKQHSTNPSCAACHQKMDPIGLGLENYDAVGRYRTMDGGKPIDASGQLPDGALPDGTAVKGASFNGAKELEARVAEDPRFADCTARKLYTYALGRVPIDQPSHLDGPAIASLVQSLKSGHSFRDLVRGIVMSPTFTSRRGEPATESKP